MYLFLMKNRDGDWKGGMADMVCTTFAETRFWFLV